MNDITWLKNFHKKITDVHLHFLQQQEAMFQSFLEVEEKLMKQTSVLLTQNVPDITESSNRPSSKQAAVEVRKKSNNPEALTAAPTLLHKEHFLIHASGKLSSIFGSQFEEVDSYKRRLRLPSPPYLLIDKVTSLEKDIEKRDEGTITTELDLHDDTWYLHEGRIPLSIMLEACQGLILLLSWLGWDFYHQGEKTYRMLGGSFKLLGEYPRIGDTLKYNIHVYKSKKDLNNLILIDYECYVGEELRLSVHNGSGGFFTEQELNSSKGILWDPNRIKYISDRQPDPPLVDCQHSQFSKTQIDAFSRGDLFACFGKGYEFGQTHIHTPRIQSGRMRLFDEIQVFDPKGGPWQRGYLRATQKVSPEDWFFACHFKNDPVMPGLLSIEVFIQTMSFYLAGLGYTLNKDGWRFEIMREEEYTFQARGQVTPSTQGVIYEVFVEDVIADPYPTLVASLLATTFEGVKIYQLSHLGVRLVPDAPLSRHPELIPKEPLKPAVLLDGIKLDYHSFLELAIGNPTKAFGESYKLYNQGMRMPRIPAPPFLFMSQVVQIKGKKEEFKIGEQVKIEYDIPSDAWYFNDNSSAVMPLCVLIESILQPAGWLSVFIGTILQSSEERFARNLNGSATVYKALFPDSGTIRTETCVKNISSAGDIDIETFDIKCFIQDELICEAVTSFGFFSEESLTQQIGLPTTEHDRSILKEISSTEVDLLGYSKRGLMLGQGRLKMIDRITGFWKDGGSQGLGLLRAEKDVHPSDWFFKGHFYRDPVQPGSLGLEGMTQLLEYYLMEQTGWEHFTDPFFEVPALDTTINWKYRGQVLTSHNHIIYIMEIDSLKSDTSSLLATAHASLWVGGKRIYEADFGVRLRDRAIK